MTVNNKGREKSAYLEKQALKASTQSAAAPTAEEQEEAAARAMEAKRAARNGVPLADINRGKLGSSDAEMAEAEREAEKNEKLQAKKRAKTERKAALAKKRAEKKAAAAAAPAEPHATEQPSSFFDYFRSLVGATA
mmetsp:Transcript_3123/g.9123  ORF Transcript_3123/g.9123 Transcript_3123/m.9123 type:complete len:136 (-) Transcript_3123:113-520(-)|eukprot:CAMPEP_0119260338 /NCGR_PEP_ID=MMETSP1329-20130426/767_1 /TAXON_ID=114041 /ORGANISM="Genus nov. species nov., Strain RCC1024" /LENGTH=135 /DNA_ID=CAMNT_0007259761 /DNA_START=339 /DNA_END=746 /DNA_ORIENTATION=+